MLKTPSPRPKTDRAKTPSLFDRLKHLEAQVFISTIIHHLHSKYPHPQAATARSEALNAKQANTALKEELRTTQFALEKATHNPCLPSSPSPSTIVLCKRKQALNQRVTPPRPSPG